MKPGYKQSEVGVIPEDWEVVRLDEVANVTSGKRLPLGTMLTERDTGIPYIRVVDMTRGGVRLSDLRFVPTEVAPTIERYRVLAGDLFISVAGTLGIIGRVPKELDGANLTENADRIWGFRCNASLLLHLLLSPSVQEVIESERTVGAQPKLALVRIRGFAIPLPQSEREQEAIAEALSDADALIESLEALIAKKRQIKQGAMQELLTGKRRLPGFSGEWETRLFDNMCSLRSERFSSSTVVERPSMCIELEHVAPRTGRLLSYAETSGDFSQKTRFFRGDVLFGKLRAYLRKYWLCLSDGVCSTEFWVMKCADEVCSAFLYYTVCSDPFVERASTVYGTHMPRSDWTVVRRLEVRLPPLQEQLAIANVLSDLDSELEALETKLEKARAIKQGMMQELLTGRTRLVPAEVS